MMTNNYFSLFRLPEQYTLDNDALNQIHRTLIAQFHPDKFAAASSFEQKQAVMMTAMLNEAHRVLSQPLERAAYLLKQHGIDADAPEHTHFAPEFLMQQMTWREILSDAKMDNDMNQLNQLSETIGGEQKNLFQQLQAAFEQGNHEQAADLLRKGRFLAKLMQEIQAAIE